MKVSRFILGIPCTTTPARYQIIIDGCHAIELLGNYVDVAIQRWQAFTGEIATLDGNGRTFEAVVPNAGRIASEGEMGRRAHRPDASQPRQVEALAAYGIPEANISRIVGV